MTSKRSDTTQCRLFPLYNRDRLQNNGGFDNLLADAENYTVPCRCSVVHIAVLGRICIWCFFASVECAACSVCAHVCVCLFVCVYVCTTTDSVCMDRSLPSVKQMVPKLVGLAKQLGKLHEDGLVHQAVHQHSVLVGQQGDWQFAELDKAAPKDSSLEKSMSTPPTLTYSCCTYPITRPSCVKQTNAKACPISVVLVHTSEGLCRRYESSFSTYCQECHNSALSTLWLAWVFCEAAVLLYILWC